MRAGLAVDLEAEADLTYAGHVEIFEGPIGDGVLRKYTPRGAEAVPLTR